MFLFLFIVFEFYVSSCLRRFYDVELTSVGVFQATKYRYLLFLVRRVGTRDIIAEHSCRSFIDKFSSGFFLSLFLLFFASRYPD